jgi:hypothetical protein
MCRLKTKILQTFLINNICLIFVIYYICFLLVKKAKSIRGYKLLEIHLSLFISIRTFSTNPPPKVQSI